MKKIGVVFNGGTISMKIDPRLQAAVPSLTGEEIMNMVIGIEKYAKIKNYNFSNLPGPHVTPKKMLELSCFVKKIIQKDDIDGIVITHGTDTLEETAYFLDLNVKTTKPIIVTGAMRNSSELGYDGPANLAASICTAISDEARGKGVIVCMNDELNAAQEVTKVHSMHLNTFQSPEFGPIGIVDNNKVIFYRTILQNEHILTENIEKNVELIKCVAGMDSSIIDFMVEKGTKGIVIEGLGRGNVPPDMIPGIKRAIEKGVVLILVTRCFMGRVLDSYGYSGGGSDLRNIGVIFGNNLPGQKARIKLMLALGITNAYKEIKKIFEKGMYSI
ncbi:asparaginase [Clostridium sediminicola]|uniref:asparaginase n=1 Tax=Clostridium sediminicola TaxID=3114879 RepID=UPI0031F1C798